MICMVPVSYTHLESLKDRVRCNRGPVSKDRVWKKRSDFCVGQGEEDSRGPSEPGNSGTDLFRGPHGGGGHAFGGAYACHPG